MSSAAAPPPGDGSPLFAQGGGPFDPKVHPFIVSHLLSFFSHDLFCLVRAVSRDYRYLCDRELAYHLEIVPVSARTKDALALKLSKPRTSYCSNLKIPGLDYIDHNLLAKGLSDSAIRMLSFVQVLEIHNKGHKWYYGQELSPEQNVKQISNLCASLAPYLTNLDVLKLSEAPWYGALPFVGRTLAVTVGLEELPGNKWAIPPIPPFWDFETLDIKVDHGTNNFYVDDDTTEEITWVQPPVLRFPSTLRNIALESPRECTFYSSYEEGSREALQTQVPRIILGVLDAKFFLQPAATCTISMDDREPFDITSEQVVSWVEARLRKSGILEPKVLGFVEVRHHNDPPGRVQVDSRSSESYDRRPMKRKFELEPIIDPAVDKALRAVEDVFLNQTDPFTANGVAKLEGALRRVLIYHNGPGDSISTASLPLSVAACAALFDAGSPSPFGRGSDLVFDEKYRLAREIKSPGFTVTGDILAQTSLLSYLQTTLSTGPLYATISKLNVYPEGGFFKPHRDTPQGDNHLGTLTLCLPSSFTGGELVVRHKGEEEVSDWAATAGTGSQVVPWTFLYSNCEHEVLPVTSGTRITVAYDVYIHEGHKHRFSSEATLSRATAALSSALDDRDFLINGGVLAFGLQHEYSKAPSAPESDGNRSFLPMLKGIDATWVECVAKLGLAFEFVAAYEDVDSDFVRFKQAYRNRTLAASRDFFQWKDAYGEENVTMDEVPVKNLHWVTYPGAWGIENHYTSYGNEPQAGVRYVSVAIFAYVGPPGERTSFNETTFKDVNPLKRISSEGSDVDESDSDDNETAETGTADGSDSDDDDSESDGWHTTDGSDSEPDGA